MLFNELGALIRSIPECQKRRLRKGASSKWDLKEERHVLALQTCLRSHFQTRRAAKEKRDSLEREQDDGGGPKGMGRDMVGREKKGE